MDRNVAKIKSRIGVAKDQSFARFRSAQSDGRIGQRELEGSEAFSGAAAALLFGHFALNVLPFGASDRALKSIRRQTLRNLKSDACAEAISFLSIAIGALVLGSENLRGLGDGAISKAVLEVSELFIPIAGVSDTDIEMLEAASVELRNGAMEAQENGEDLHYAANPLLHRLRRRIIIRALEKVMPVSDHPDAGWILVDPAYRDGIGADHSLDRLEVEERLWSNAADIWVSGLDRAASETRSAGQR